MKIRLQSGSVRYRLRQSDAKNLVMQGIVEESIALGDQTLVCSLELYDGPPSLELQGAKFKAAIPQEDTRRWQASDEVGIYYTTATGTRIAVEKDWACLEPVSGETNEDAFERPKKASHSTAEPQTDHL